MSRDSDGKFRSNGNAKPKSKRHPREEEVPALDSPLFENVRQRFQAEFEVERDIAAEIAHALFIGNRQAIYAAFGKKLMEGNIKVLEALAARAYGMPRQTSTVHHEPFRLEVVQVGSSRREAIEVHVPAELTEGESTKEDA